MKLRKHFLLFMAPDEGSAEIPSREEVDPETTPTEEETSVEPEVEPEPTPAPITRIEVDHEALGRVIGESMRSAQAPPQETEADAAKRLNLYSASQKDVDDLMEGGETAVAAMNRMLQGKAREVATVINTSFTARLFEVATRFEPLLSDAQQRKAEQYVTEMIAEHPDLAPIKAQIPGLTNALYTNGFKGVPNNPTETRKTVASAIRAMNLIPPGSQKTAPKHTNIPGGNGGGASSGARPKVDKEPNDFLSVFAQVTQ